MNRLRLLPIALALAATAASTAEARPRPQHAARKRFESNKGFGLGLELGEPSGITGKYWLGDATDRALQFGVGYVADYYYYQYNGFYAYVDYLFHLTSLASTDSFELPFYIGVGAQFWNWYYNPDNRFRGDALGVRVPIGLAFDLNNVPIDIFFQLTPNVSFLFGEPAGLNSHPDFFLLNFSLGIRYYFN